ncbi:MAG: hypothetical protein ACYTDT_00785 [Planctomycetota bacterium]
MGDQLFGLGDAGFFTRARYLWWVPGDASERSISLSLSSGVEMPTGASSIKRDGLEIPRELQPGRGGYSLTVAHMAHFGMGKLDFGGRIDLASTLRVRINSIGIGGSGYDFGDEFSHEFNFKLRVIQEKPFPGNTMFVGLGIIYAAKTPDKDNGKRVVDSGHREVALKPWLAWHPKPHHIFLMEARIPVYRSVNGTQLVEAVGFFVSYGRRF